MATSHEKEFVVHAALLVIFKIRTKMEIQSCRSSNFYQYPMQSMYELFLYIQWIFQAVFQIIFVQFQVKIRESSLVSNEIFLLCYHRV